jgi:predicted CoA-binding protein
MLSDDELRALLQRTRTIAVVGLSDKPDRPSYHVAGYLIGQGYRVIPVNPGLTEVLGLRCFPELRDIPEAVDMVDVFRRSEAVPAIAADAVAIGAQSLWLQEGVIHEEAAAAARAGGLQVVMDRCILKEHRRLLAGG